MNTNNFFWILLIFGIIGPKGYSQAISNEILNIFHEHTNSDSLNLKKLYHFHGMEFRDFHEIFKNNKIRHEANQLYGTYSFNRGKILIKSPYEKTGKNSKYLVERITGWQLPFKIHRYLDSRDIFVFKISLPDKDRIFYAFFVQQRYKILDPTFFD